MDINAKLKRLEELPNAIFKREQEMLEKRKELETLVSLKSQTVSNALNNLKKLKLVTGNRGDYRIDPKVLWLGNINTRNVLLKGDDGLNVNLQFKAE